LETHRLRSQADINVRRLSSLDLDRHFLIAVSDERSQENLLTGWHTGDFELTFGPCGGPDVQALYSDVHPRQGFRSRTIDDSPSNGACVLSQSSCRHSQ
jgi:hypothetical protein